MRTMLVAFVLVGAVACGRTSTVNEFRTATATDDGGPPQAAGDVSVSQYDGGMPPRASVDTMDAGATTERGGGDAQRTAALIMQWDGGNP